MLTISILQEKCVCNQKIVSKLDGKVEDCRLTLVKNADFIGGERKIFIHFSTLFQNNYYACLR